MQPENNYRSEVTSAGYSIQPQGELFQLLKFEKPIQYLIPRAAGGVSERPATVMSHNKPAFFGTHRQFEDYSV